MSLKIFSTQSRQKEEFVPLQKGEVKMYVCGPTVYDFLHIGNFRGAVFFNLVRNWLEDKGYKVTYVYNYTDVDDKIIERSKTEGISAQEVAEKYIREFETDYASLKLRPHTKNPKVTEHIEDIVQLVKDLVSKGKAYEVDGEVFYDVKSFPEYGKLSNKNLDELEAGSRVEVDTRKKHPADFALWKQAKEGEPAWPSPWGGGRPGWHIECSAMNRALLGEQIDIHGGGLDLVFPHHENEIAQSEGCTGHTFAKYWMHNNLIQISDQKMSKSLGNIIKAREFIEQHDAEVFKYMMLSAHYRSVSNVSEEQMEQAISGLARIYSALAWAKQLMASEGESGSTPKKFNAALEDGEKHFNEAMDDDFNTPGVLAAIFDLVRVFNNLCRTPGKITPEKKAVAESFTNWMVNKGKLMALFQEDPTIYLRGLDDRLLEKKGLERQQVNDVVQQRAEARSSKDFDKADQLRDQLTEWGISVQDTPGGSYWEVDK